MLKSLPPPSKGLRLVDLHRSVTEADIEKTIVQIAVEEMDKTPDSEIDEAILETLDASAVIRAVRKQIQYFNRELIPCWYYAPSSLIRNAENYPRRSALLEPTPRYNNLVATVRVMHNLVREKTDALGVGLLFMFEGNGGVVKDKERGPVQSLDYEEITRESFSSFQALQRALSTMLARRVPTQVIDFCTNELRRLYPSLGEAEKEALERGRQRFHQLYDAAQKALI